MIWPGVPVVGPDRKQAPSRTKIIVSHVKLGLSTSTLGHCFYFGGTWIEAKTEPTAMIFDAASRMSDHTQFIHIHPMRNIPVPSGNLT
jgi:hypothetical protein